VQNDFCNTIGHEQKSEISAWDVLRGSSRWEARAKSCTSSSVRHPTGKSGSVADGKVQLSPQAF